VIKGLSKLGVPEVAVKSADQFFWIAIAVSAVGLLWAVWQSKREGGSMTD
jgi:hypothetical protein